MHQRTLPATAAFVFTMAAAPIAMSFELAAQVPLPAKAPPPASQAVAIAAGVEVLLELQEAYRPDRRAPRMSDRDVLDWQVRERSRLRAARALDGEKSEWPYEGVHRVRGVVPPGYRVGGTAIVASALVQVAGFDADPRRQAAVQRALKFMLAELADNELLAPGPKSGYDVRGWAHIYGLDFLLLLERRKLVAAELKKPVAVMIQHLLGCLAKNETRGGGWNYANDSCSPFMTGSTLLALYHARAQGVAVDHAMVERALAGLQAAQGRKGSYAYSGTTKRPGGRRRRVPMPGACARAAIAELCLYRAGRSTPDKLRRAVDGFFAHWDELLVRKGQQGTHVGAYNIAPYYYFYGHTYAALAIEALPAADRPALRVRMQKILWATRENDGGWNDRIFPRSKSYSTAMALLALIAPELDAVPTWSTAPLDAKRTKPPANATRRVVR